MNQVQRAMILRTMSLDVASEMLLQLAINAPASFDKAYNKVTAQKVFTGYVMTNEGRYQIDKEILQELVLASIDVIHPHFGTAMMGKVRAIKACRELTGMGLKAAKDTIELLAHCDMLSKDAKKWDVIRYVDDDNFSASLCEEGEVKNQPRGLCLRV